MNKINFLKILFILTNLFFSVNVLSESKKDQIFLSDQRDPQINIESNNDRVGIPAFTMKVGPDGSEDYSISLQILA